MRSCTKLSYDREPLNQLLEAAVAAYVNTTHSRYISIDFCSTRVVINHNFIH